MLRAWPPLNRPVTAFVRAATRRLGVEWPFAVRHLHRVGHVRSRLPNGRDLVLWSRGDDWVANLVFWKGWQAYEPETAPLFFQLAERAQAVVDVGAYVGYYSLLAAHARPEGRVLALEPHPAAYERLLRNVSANGLGNVRCLRVAAGAVSGESVFHSMEGLPTSSSLSLDFMRGTPGLRSAPVPVTTVDLAVAEHHLPRIDLVKIDTESTEPDVVAGMQKTLARDRPDIICEVLSGRGTGRALERALRPLGYRFHLLTAEGPVEWSRIEGHPTYLNYLFSTKDTVAPA